MIEGKITACSEAGPLAGVEDVSERANTHFSDNFCSGIARAVINNDDVVGVGLDFFENACDVGLFVEGGDNYPDFV